MCHRLESGTRAPLPEVLHKMSRRSILTSLETGAMKSQGAGLTSDERASIAAYLGTADDAAASPSAGVCAVDPGPMTDALG